MVQFKGLTGHLTFLIQTKGLLKELLEKHFLIMNIEYKEQYWRYKNFNKEFSLFFLKNSDLWDSQKILNFNVLIY